MAGGVGIEPTLQESNSCVLTITLTALKALGFASFFIQEVFYRQEHY